MPYAVLQRSLEIPAVDKLKRAFRCMPGLVEMDAYTLAKDAFGILVREQEQSDAVRLQQALRAEGIETDVVDEAELIPLPP
ncbi:MAG TPA: hypothetical protein VK968_16110, partial [Roseimicrobium sp.]|nr:hypothetical protein [Roseimicrobium sp.]